MQKIYLSKMRVKIVKEITSNEKIFKGIFGRFKIIFKFGLY